MTAFLQGVGCSTANPLPHQSMIVHASAVRSANKLSVRICSKSLGWSFLSRAWDLGNP